MSCRVSSSSELLSLLTQLANFKPYRSARFFGREYRAIEGVSNWILGLTYGLSMSIILLAVYLKFWGAGVVWVKSAALLIAVFAQLSVVLFAVVKALGVLLLATRWERVTLTTLLREVEVNEGHAGSLRKFSTEVMDRAEQHLRSKLSWLEKRAGAFLGDKTAMLSFFALAMSIVKDAGGLSWISRALDPDVGVTSWESISLYFFAFLFGASLGALGLKMLAGRIRYQLDVLSLGRSRVKLPVSSIGEGGRKSVSRPHSPSQ